MSFVVTSGQMRAIQRAPSVNALVPVTAYVQLSAQYSTTYEALYRSQPALRTVISFLARNIAQLPLDPYERVSASDRRKLVDHPLAQLLERPFPGTKWTKYRLINTLVHELCIHDNAYWLKLYDNGVRGIAPIPARMVQPLGSDWFAPSGYRIFGSSGHRDVGADDVVHFHGYNPDDPRSGLAPIETLRQILAEEFAAGQYREQMWRNGARVGGYIRRPKDAPKWSETAANRFRQDWSALYTGDGPNAGGTPVLEDGMEFVPSGVTPRDAQYVESRKLTREEVAAAYHVSPSTVGLIDGATHSSMQELHKMLYQDTLAPTLVQLAQDIECQLLPDFDTTGNVYVEFNMSEKLRGSFEEQAKALQSSVGGPWMLRSEARAMYNLPDVDGADELIVPLNVVTGGLASPNDTAPDNPSNEESNGQLPKAAHAALRRTITRQKLHVLTQLGAHFSGDAVVFDRKRWDRELASDLQMVGVDTDEATRIAARVNADTAGLIGAALAADDAAATARRMFDAIEALAERGELIEAR